MERQQGNQNSLPQRKRQATISQSIGRGGRRRAKALWFNMETTPDPGAGDSFLPSMIISPPKDQPWPLAEVPPVPPLPPLPPTPSSGSVSPPIGTLQDLGKMLPKKNKLVPKASFTSTVKEPSSSGNSTPFGYDFSENGRPLQSPMSSASMSPRTAESPGVGNSWSPGGNWQIQSRFSTSELLPHRRGS